jgi:hypothetical protein
MTPWIRAGETWQAAFHGQDPIFDPNNPPPLAKAAGEKESKKDDRAFANAKVAADPSTVAMMAVEKSVWEAWMAKDAAKLQELTTPDLSRSKTYMAPILLDLFRCESAMLRTYWVLEVMDQFTRRIVGFAVHRGVVDGVALCRMFNRAIRAQTLPKYLSSDHDPLYRFQPWQANLRVLGCR